MMIYAPQIAPALEERLSEHVLTFAKLLVLTRQPLAALAVRTIRLAASVTVHFKAECSSSYGS